ncbi:MAG TPA: hypothetical protein VFE37_22355, partial [Chloroflexota bacterium]|nr:hypothetical protein [Chloroflexota bacterium]
ALAPAGPGRYRAALDAPPPGAYVVQVAQALADGAERRGEVGWVAPYPAEYRQTGVDQALLARVAAAGGGRILQDPLQAVAPAERPAAARWSLVPLLLALAALCWPLEIAARRLALPPLAARLPRARPVPAPAPSQAPASVATGRAPESPQPAPADTTRRLLDRKRALRERQRQEARR